MISVVIVGSGNVATHLIHVFLKIDSVNLKQVYTRNSTDLDVLKKIVPTTNSLELIVPADVTIIAVHDDAISEISSQISNSFVAHTSGSVHMNALKSNSGKGVFYPLQSFSKEKEVLFHDIPFCLETENKDDFTKLETLVTALKGKVYPINSEQRKSIHVAAVFVNNFTNHMYVVANDICKQYNVPFDILESLILETSQKIKDLSPIEAQTGPAKRNDQKTIQNHLNLLNKAQQEIYLKLTESIQQHGKKL